MIFKKKEKEEIRSTEELTELLTLDSFKDLCDELFLKQNLQKAIFLIEIDNYDELVTAYSQTVLNEIQRKVAKLIQNNMYLKQFAAHIDDDTYISVGKGLSAAMALTVAKLLMNSVKNMKINAIDDDGSVTNISLTVSVGLYNVSEIDVLSTAIMNVNTALEAAIEKGGNQVEVFKEKWNFVA